MLTKEEENQIKKEQTIARITLAIVGVIVLAVASVAGYILALLVLALRKYLYG